MTDFDTRPAIIKFVETVNRALGGTLDPGWHTTVPIEHRAPAVNSVDRTRMQLAARCALSTYPGPVGELIHRELHAFLEFGYRFDHGTGLAARLVEHVMAELPVAAEIGSSPCSGDDRQADPEQDGTADER